MRRALSDSVFGITIARQYGENDQFILIILNSRRNYQCKECLM